MTATEIDLGTTIRLARHAKNLTQKEFAEIAQVSPRWLSKAETNTLPANTRPAQIRLVAEALDRDPTEFLRMLGFGRAVRTKGRISRHQPKTFDAAAPEVGRESQHSLQIPAVVGREAVTFEQIKVTSPWREHLNDICDALHKLETTLDEIQTPTQTTYAKLRNWAADVSMRKVREKLNDFASSEFSFENTEALEELWKGIFEQITKKVWTTNLSRLGAFGGRSASEHSLYVQKNAVDRIKVKGCISRLFVVHEDECDEGKELLQFSEVLHRQWDIGIRVGLISPNQFHCAVSRFVSPLRSLDFMLLDDEAIYYSVINDANNFIAEGEFSNKKAQKEAITNIIAKLDGPQIARWFVKTTKDEESPKFISELQYLRQKLWEVQESEAS